MKNKILQIEYTPCGEYIFVSESDGKVAVILNSDLTYVTKFEIPFLDKKTLQVNNQHFEFEYNLQQQLKYVWIVSNLTNIKQDHLSFNLVCFCFKQNIGDSRFFVELKFEKMMSSTESALAFNLNKVDF